MSQSREVELLGIMMLKGTHKGFIKVWSLEGHLDLAPGQSACKALKS